MVGFRYIQDVEEWLKPLDYIAFWEAVTPYGFVLLDRDHYDGLIAGGKVDAALVLHGLKILAKMEFRTAFGLKHRIIEPTVAQYLKSVH
ncbi:hypothetical protein GOZ96_12365 [Agrobacterium vitis]|uniref:Uncharacterized protein n=1 Tax=Agrobacterium vitis TaxID=373 RepID=A0A368NS26_AGRVI|nr:hypothetical protein [Agrobacterium vitis]KAA3516960.1 hypothetical protein DXM22_10930 [Agrobacterium vitis]KAA3529725.1 hypothetical protein DXT89_08455 [Agrobacterium vitis]MUZ97396.1 hypothetical protein [Agrobacterium vitis]NOJ36226.1 hypothetical protein [Agrobacterium vitis]RCU52279.1 hypothetical protein ASB66_019290 [Agrobacterium vitis]